MAVVGILQQLNFPQRSEMIDALSDDLTQINRGQAVSNL
jgi:hypothetical protein